MKSLLSALIIASCAMVSGIATARKVSPNPDDSFCAVSGVRPTTFKATMSGIGMAEEKSGEEGSAYTWFLHPCGNGSSIDDFPPNNQKDDCMNFGLDGTYFAFWDPKAFGGRCQIAFHTWGDEQKWNRVWDEDTNTTAYRTKFYNFPEGGMNVATITITCDPHASNLEPMGRALRTPTRDHAGNFDNKYNVKLRSNAVCAKLPVTPAPITECTRHTSCFGCVNVPSGNCGYCNTTNKCLQGTLSGPGDGAICTGDHWKYEATAGRGYQCPSKAKP